VFVVIQGGVGQPGTTQLYKHNKGGLPAKRNRPLAGGALFPA
jgi:hypothetical protein